MVRKGAEGCSFKESNDEGKRFEGPCTRIIENKENSICLGNEEIIREGAA